MNDEQTPMQGQGGDVPELAPDAAIQIDGQNVPISELVQARQQALQLQSELEQARQNSVDPDRLAEMELIDRALKGDPAAGEQVWQKYAPKNEEPVAPEDERFTNLTTQIETLKAELAQAKGVTDSITTQQGLQELGSLIKTSEENYPNLAAHPEAVALVNRTLEEMEAVAQQRGTTITSLGPDAKRQLLATAFSRNEDFIVKTIEAYGGQPKTAPAKGAPIQAVDDQGEAKPNASVNRAYMGVDNQGNLIDRRTGKPILSAQGDRVVPDASVPAVPSGTPLGLAEGAFESDKVFSGKAMRDAMKDASTSFPNA